MATGALLAACTGDLGFMAPPSREAQLRAPRAAVPKLPVAPTATPPLVAILRPTPPIPTPATAAAVASPTPMPPGEAAEILKAPAPVVATPPPAAVSFTVPLASLSQLQALDEKPEIEEILRAARRYPASSLYLAAYATEEDARERDTDAKSLSDHVVVEMGRYLARRGVAPDRISGKGMGADPLVGRAVMVSIDLIGGGGIPGSPRQIAEREAAQLAPDRFPQQNATFKEVEGGAAYRVGPGDQLRIVNFLTTSAPEHLVTVNSSGMISFDLVQNVRVAGLTTQEIESLLANVLQRYYRSPRLTVEVKSYASRTITLVGPSGARSLPLSGRMTLLDLLARDQVATGGGVPGQGSVGLPDFKDVRVVRGKQQFTVNLFRIVLDRDWKENLVLDDGDIVYLPSFSETGNYTIVLGAVANPGLYPMPRSLTAVQALYGAGGPTRGAYLPHARIIRGNLKQPQLIPADIDLVVEKGTAEADRPLQSGDILFVPSTRIANWNQILADLGPTINLATLPLGGVFGATLLFGPGGTQ